MAQINDSTSKTQGRWTKQEHQKFVQGFQLFGKDWKRIQEYIQTRNGAQIRSHAQKFFLRMKKQLNFEATDQDDMNLTYFQNKSFEQQLIMSKSQEDKEHSYFFEKILKLTNENEQFDFWETLVDHKSHEDSNQLETGISKRKNSFLIWDEESIELQNQHLKASKKIKVD